MADNFGAKPYDYSDYYKPIRGRNEADALKGNEVAPGMSITEKLRSLFGALGINQTPVDLNNPNAGIGEKLRGGLGLAPALQPTATQADVRKSDLAMAGPGAVPTMPAPAAVAPAPSASQADVRKSDNTIAAANPVQYVDGAWAPPHGASPGIGAQLEPGPATTRVSSSRDANGNLVLTNAPPAPAPAPAAPAAPAGGFGARPAVAMPAMPAPVRDTFQNKAARGGLASFFGASMNEKKLATEEVQNIAAAEAQAAREMEAQKINATLAAATATKPGDLKNAAEATILSERMRLAAAATDPAMKAAILGGYSPTKNEPTFPTGLQPIEGGYGVAAQGGKLTRVPIASAPKAMTMAEALADAKKYGKNPTPAQFRLDAALRGITIKD